MLFHVITLGCPRNEVASDHIIQTLNTEHDLVYEPGSADIVVINTCGFIEAARADSIRAILEIAARKPRVLVVAGCLAERYYQELVNEMPEIDVLLGIENYAIYPEAIKAALSGERFLAKTEEIKPRSQRTYSERKISPYLQISDGCDERCSFCAIPGIRGSFRSLPAKGLIEEAKMLLGRGALEINLVAQDLAGYGADLEALSSLSELLAELDCLDGEFWLRCLYLQPHKIKDSLLETIAGATHVCRYLDIPFQHGSASVLRKMRRVRPGYANKDDYLGFLQRIRSIIPGVVIRSTFIVGFPGETEADFLELCEFIDKAQLEYAGFFAYSQEEGTAAEKLAGAVPDGIIDKRLEEAQQLQSEISLDKISRRIGQEVMILIENYDQDCRCFEGRTQQQAPDIDGVARILDTGSLNINTGRFVKARIVAVEDFDLICEVRQ